MAQRTLGLAWWWGARWVLWLLLQALVTFGAAFVVTPRFSFISQCKTVPCRCRCRHLRRLHHHHRLSQVRAWRRLPRPRCPRRPRRRHPPCPGQPLPPWCSTRGWQVKPPRVSSVAGRGRAPRWDLVTQSPKQHPLPLPGVHSEGFMRGESIYQPNTSGLVWGRWLLR